jgi:hypothetical protein
MNAVYLVLFQSVLLTFTCCKQFLQREEPLIATVSKVGTLGKYIKPAVPAESQRACGLYLVNPANDVDNQCSLTGFMMRDTTRR